MPLELPGPGETIEVCQDCGHVVDPQRALFQGTTYEIRQCLRDECIALRVADAVWGDQKEEASRRLSEEIMYRRLAAWFPVVNDPRAGFRIMGE